MIGTVTPTQNSMCSCCYTQPWPQTFEFELVKGTVNTAAVAAGEVSAAAVSTGFKQDNLDFTPPAHGHSGILNNTDTATVKTTAGSSDNQDPSSSQLLEQLTVEMRNEGSSRDAEARRGGGRQKRRRRTPIKRGVPVPPVDTVDDTPTPRPEVPPSSPEDNPGRLKDIQLPTAPKPDDRRDPTSPELPKANLPTPPKPDDNPTTSPELPEDDTVPPASPEDNTTSPELPEDDTEVPPASPEDDPAPASTVLEAEPAFALEDGGGRRMLSSSHQHMIGTLLRA